MNYSISPDRRTLTITADEGERANLRDLSTDGADYNISSDEAMVDFLEPLVCNSELEWVYPEATGDLTDAPMLGIITDDRAKGGRMGVTERWAHMSYQVRSLLQDLRDYGSVTLVSGN